MRATEFILEYKTVQTFKALGKNTFRFETGAGMVYTISLKREFDTEHSKLVISFTTTDPASGKPTNGRTNTGNAVSIFGTVLSTLLEYLKSLPQDQLPDMLEFSAEAADPGRVSLYNRIAHSDRIPGYEFKESGQLDPSSPSSIYFTMKRRVTLAESASEREIAQAQYMQGECAVLALTIRNMNPQRFTLGFVYEFFDSSPDMYLEPDEFDELDPARQQDIKYNHENWTLTHAYVYDVLTREYIDAEGRHNQLPMIGRSFNSTRHNKFPAETQDLVNVSHYMEYDEAQEKWIVLRGWDAVDKAYTPEDKQRAREYAIKYLGIDQPAQAVTESLDAPYPLRWNNNGSYDSAVFKLANGRSGSVTFQTKNENAPVHVAFTVDNTAEVSGGGDEQRIFATAIHAIREWLSQNSPLLIEFTAKPANRFRLYQTMVRRYANSFGYQQIPSNKPNTFTLVKKTTMAPGQPTPPPLTELEENFADGRNPEDRGDSARHDIPKKASLNTLDKIVHSKSAGPRKKQLAHWQANMRRGRAK